MGNVGEEALSEALIMSGRMTANKETAPKPISKTAVSTRYIEDMKEKHPALILPVGRRRAIVVGSEYGPAGENIGRAISNRLMPDFAGVIDHNKASFDLCGISPARMLNEFKGVDTLILANGATNLDWIEDQPDLEINTVLDDSLRGSIFAAKRFVQATIDDENRKYLVFIGSMAYRSVLNGSSVYCAAKAGLAAFAKCLAWELAPKGYSVFCVHPSNTEGTPMTEQTIQGLMRYRHLSRESAEAYWAASLPKHAWLQPEDIAETVSFLVSGKADYLAGSPIEMGGGQR